MNKRPSDEEIKTRLSILTNAMEDSTKADHIVIAVRELEWVLGERKTYQFKELVGPKK
jgi:hypothetical protein